MNNTIPAESVPARALEYVYVCVSEQMPGVFKVGETHRQTPEKRAQQFTGIDKQVTWSVLRAFATPNSRHSEKLVHTRLNAMGVRYGEHREMFQLGERQLMAIIEVCVTLTPVPEQKTIADVQLVAVPDEAGPWREALSLPLTYNGQTDMTLGRAMALAAAGDVRLQKKIVEHGVELVYPDADNPHFRVHSLPGTKLAHWLKVQGITWSQLAIPEGGQHRKVKCVTSAGL